MFFGRAIGFWKSESNTSREGVSNCPMCSCFSCWSATHSPCIYFCVAKAPDKAVTGVLLLDSHQVGDRQIGVLGATYSWEIDRKIVESVNIFIIAGGLGPHNVVDAITVV